MSDNPVKITIKGKVNYEDEITVTQAAQIITFLNATEGVASMGATTPDFPLATQGGAGGSATDQVSEKAVGSAREALDLSNAKTNPEKIVALGEYVLQDGGQTFKVEDVKAAFRRARETVPGNLSRDLSLAVQAGWIAEADRGEYYVTNKIQGIFDGDFKFPKAGNGVRPRGAAKSTKGKVEKPAVFVNIDEFPSQMTGFPAYGKMKSNRDKILWALQFVSTNGVRGLSNKDIEWVTNEIGTGVPNKQITAAFTSGKSAGYMSRSTQDRTIRITEDGTAYLKTVGTSES